MTYNASSGINMDIYNYTEVDLIGIIENATLVKETDDSGTWLRVRRYINILDHLDDTE